MRQRPAVACDGSGIVLFGGDTFQWNFYGDTWRMTYVPDVPATGRQGIIVLMLFLGGLLFFSVRR